MSNTRIKELEQQSYITVKDENSFDCLVFSKEKFAELIVRECASMAKAFHNHGYDFTGDLELDEFMLKHFGVES